MAGFFLHLEVDTRGIDAKIIESGNSSIMIREECQVLYESLSLTEDRAAHFKAGMEIVAQKIDLDSCSTGVVFVPDSYVSFRGLQMPFGSHKKIRQILPIELETFLPLEDESYISDFHVIENYDGGSQILSASIASSIVEDYFSTLADFNIQLQLITPKGYATAAGFLNEWKDSPDFVFIHLSQNLATQVVVHNSKPCFVRYLPGKNFLPDELAKYIKQTLTGFSHRTGSDIGFEFFISSDDPGFEPASFYAALKNILNYDIKYGGDIQNIETEAYLCSILPGKKVKYLFNFCKGKYSTSSFFQKYFINIAAGISLLIIALSLMLASAGFDNAKLDRQVKALDQRALEIFRQAFPAINKVTDPYMEMEANVKSAIKKAGLQNGANASGSNIDVKMVNLMGELSGKIDASLDMEISRFFYNNGRLILSGSTDNFNNVDKIKGRFELSEIFKKVEISSAASDKRENRVNFKFIIDM